MSTDDDFPTHGGKREGAGRPRGPRPDPDNASVLMQNAKAKKEMYKAQLAELTYHERRAELATHESYRRALSLALQAANATLLTLPPRLAGQMAAETNARKLEVFLEGELKAACLAWSDAVLDAIPI